MEKVKEKKKKVIKKRAEKQEITVRLKIAKIKKQLLKNGVYGQEQSKKDRKNLGNQQK